MALVTKINYTGQGSPLDFVGARHVPRLSGNLKAATDLSIGSLVYIDSDGDVALSDGTAVHGIIVNDYKAGEQVTIFQVGARLRYSTGLTPGVPLYAAAGGALDTVATTNDNLGTALAVSDTDIQLTRIKHLADPATGG